MRHCPTCSPLGYDPEHMLSSLISRLFPGTHDELPNLAAAASSFGSAESLPEIEESTFIATLGWLTAGAGALAVGLFVGRELRQRYKFNRRTPYDFYSHSGDEMQDMEFGVGI